MCAAVVLPLTGWVIHMDPLGVWHASTPGVNNVKPLQSDFQRAFKTYQHASSKPSVVYLGSSRVGYAMPAEFPGTPDDQVYNLAIDGLGWKELVALSDHAVAVHRPDVLVYGLDPWMFSKNAPISRVDPWRMAAVRWGLGLPFKLRDSVFSYRAVHAAWASRKKSRKVPDRVQYERGYRIEVGDRKGKPIDAWPNRWARHVRKGGRRFKVEEEALQGVVQDIREKRAQGIDTLVVLVPDHADLQASLWCHPRARNHLKQVKKALSEVGFLDTYGFSSYTEKHDNYTDPRHANGKLGRRIQQQLAQHEERGPGAWIDAGNANVQLDRFEAAATRWCKSEPALVELLEDKVSKKQRSKQYRKLRPWARSQN